MTDENILIPLKEWDELTRKDERKNLVIEDLREDNHNKKIEIEDLEATIEYLKKQIKLSDKEEIDELEKEGIVDEKYGDISNQDERN